MITLNEVERIQRSWTQNDWNYWEVRVQYHERNGSDRSDAQGAADIDMMYQRSWCDVCGQLMADGKDVCDTCAGSEKIEW